MISVSSEIMRHLFTRSSIPPSKYKTLSPPVSMFSGIARTKQQTCAPIAARSEGDVPSSFDAVRSEERRVGSDWSSDVCSSDLDAISPGFHVFWNRAHQATNMRSHCG